MTGLDVSVAVFAIVSSSVSGLVGIKAGQEVVNVKEFAFAAFAVVYVLIPYIFIGLIFLLVFAMAWVPRESNPSVLDNSPYLFLTGAFLWAPTYIVLLLVGVFWEYQKNHKSSGVS